MSPAEPVTWTDLATADLDVATLYDVLVLRSAVFVVEQDCAYHDPDGLDLLEGTRHLVGRNGGGQGEIAAYARILAPDRERPTPRIGRVIVSGEARGQQLGRRLMKRALASCGEHWPGQPVELGAQAHLAGFYRSLGFLEIGEPYDEDGIPHVWMRREVG
ncbi:MAG: GNAT family N-acetyltransferase [Solirubrobacterales bacterium]